MKIYLPPWYHWLNEKTEGKDDLINLLLIAVIAISVLLLLKGDRVTKSTWLVYLALP